MEPHIVKEIVDPHGKKVQEFPPRPVRRVLSERAAREMLAIMETVTQQGGTAKEAAAPGFTVAGKTGTAQKLVGHAYSHSKFSALFIGMVPADKPVLAIVVIVDEPKGAIFGGVVAAPIFREIAAQSLRVLGYYPKQEKDKNMPVLAKGASPAKGAKTAKAAPPPVSAPAPLPTLAQLLPCKLKEAKEPPTVMPDFRGCTIRQVLNLLKRRRAEMPCGGQRPGRKPGALAGNHHHPRRHLLGKISIQLVRTAPGDSSLPRTRSFYRIKPGGET